ncbi:MAG: hypothetical protein E7346_01490 [Clostridiales bacterium]|nr:hypothetical protein [Clostridiales bacterium]
MTKTFNRFFEFAFFLVLLSFSVILCTGNFTAAVTDGVGLWAAVVLPSLFPYFFITAILSSLNVTSKISNKLSPLFNKVFNVNGAVGFCYLMSLISGYPVGAKTVSDLKEKGIIGDTESIRAAALCSTSSPMFLIGSVGSLMFRSTAFGLALFFCHFLSSVIIGIIFSFYKRNDKPKIQAAFNFNGKIDNLLYESAYSSVISILVVGGLITIFYLLTEILLFYNVLSPFIKLLSVILGDNAEPLVLGLFECTKGLKNLSEFGIGLSGFLISAFICGFGGLSVIAQSVAYLKKAKIKTAPFLVAKVLQAVVSFMIAPIVYIICF